MNLHWAEIPLHPFRLSSAKKVRGRGCGEPAMASEDLLNKVSRKRRDERNIEPQKNIET
jgi:hypothetical protein